MGQQLPVTDYDIQALVDNELDDVTAKRVRAYLKENPRAQRYYDDLVEQKKLLRAWDDSRHI